MVLLHQINTVFQEIFDDPRLVVSENTTPDDISDWDSVAHVKLVLSLEDLFGIQFTTEEVAGLHSVGDFMRALGSRQLV